MAKYSNKDFEDLDITKAELKEIGEALKKEEFRKLLSDYVDEVNDPKNKAIYQKEITQLEKERGVDITFVTPHPGYVIKSSVDGVQKAFINICSNENIGKPSAVKKFENGHQGNDWSIPYILAPPKVDLDKSSKRCVVYDVIFHPDTLELAKKNREFKQLVNDTAITGVEDAFSAEFDRNNIKFPKLNFKGPKIAAVIRKKSSTKPLVNKDELLEIPNYPYKPVDENKTPTITNPRRGDRNDKTKSAYSVPKYTMKHRKYVEYDEFIDTKDAKMHAAIPYEIVLEVHLPLLNSVKDTILDVTSRTVSLVSEEPAKYKLHVDLPYDVNENSSAKFDLKTRKLIITLPVNRKPSNLSCVSREDSGIESDLCHNRSSSDEEVTKPRVEELSSNNNLPESDKSLDDLRTSDEFLPEHLHYSFPDFSIVNNGTSISIVLNVKNIEPATVSQQNVFSGSGVHFKFTSLGSGYFPLHYAFCIHFPNFIINYHTLNVEVWDNNLIINLELSSQGSEDLSNYFVGPRIEMLEKRELNNSTGVINGHQVNKFENNIEETEIKDILNDALIREDTCDNENNVTSITVGTKIEDLNDNELKCKVDDINLNLSTLKLNNYKKCHKNKKQPKVRTSSESNTTSPGLELDNRRSILKNTRSLSESVADEYNNWSSVESDAVEDINSPVVKKTVRFSDVISKKVFRPNSSILGQKHKNEKKARNRKKVVERRRRASESETSEVSDFSDYSEVSETSETSDASSDDQPSSPPEQLPSGKQHRRRGSKNSRKNAATAKQNSFILSQD